MICSTIQTGETGKGVRFKIQTISGFDIDAFANYIFCICLRKKIFSEAGGFRRAGA